jgi:hypothetical protein
MKKSSRIFLLFSSLFFFLIFHAKAQVNFETFSLFDKMLSQAKKEHKLVFVQVESKECGQCNDVAQKGLSGTALKEKFAVNFISTFLKQDNELLKEILKKAGLSDYNMGSLFFDADGYLLLKINSTTSSPMMYLNYADRAIELSKNNTLKDLTTQYQKGAKDRMLLKKLIEEKNKADFDTYSLVEEFIDSQTMKELTTLENAKLILEQGMPLESRGRKVLYALFPNKTIDSIFFAQPFQERVKINNKVSSSSRKIAIKNKDKNLSYLISSYISRTYDNNWEKGSFHSQSFLINFYKDIKDTISYLQTAESFCNYNLMNLSIDTLKRRSDRERNAMFEQKRKEQNGSSVMSFSYSPFYMKYGEELNNTAYGIFTFTNDLEKLAKALKWSKRSMEIYDALVPDEKRKQNPNYMDTYACLLYRLGKKDEAIETQTKALEILKNRGESTSNLETTLTKIKNGTL